MDAALGERRRWRNPAHIVAPNRVAGSGGGCTRPGYRLTGRERYRSQLSTLPFVFRLVHVGSASVTRSRSGAGESGCRPSGPGASGAVRPGLSRRTPMNWSAHSLVAQSTYREVCAMVRARSSPRGLPDLISSTSIRPVASRQRRSTRPTPRSSSLPAKVQPAGGSRCQKKPPDWAATCCLWARASIGEKEPSARSAANSW
jgi:hypothetical protein